MLTQLKRVGIHALVIVAPVEVADVAASYWFEEEGAAERDGGMDGVAPRFAHALGGEEILHGEVAEDVFEEFSGVQETFICGA